MNRIKMNVQYIINKQTIGTFIHCSFLFNIFYCSCKMYKLNPAQQNTTVLQKYLSSDH